MQGGNLEPPIECRVEFNYLKGWQRHVVQGE